MEISIISALRQPSDPLLMLIQLPLGFFGGGGGGGGVGIFSGRGLDIFHGGVGADIWGGSTPPIPPGKSAYAGEIVWLKLCEGYQSTSKRW